MNFRKPVFWVHLTAGVLSGLVILMMSLTGVILTYERQINAFADGIAYPLQVREDTDRRPIRALIASLRQQAPGFQPERLTVFAEPDRPWLVSAGRDRSLYINPYTAVVLGEPVQWNRQFFREITAWHRWFAAEDQARTVARAITGACNLAFLLLIVTGLYLWLPRLWRWPLVRAVLFFNPRATTGKARDYNWHHVFGIWSALPLVIVVATAVVFSYSWANMLVYRLAGEEPPPRGRRGPAPMLVMEESANNGNSGMQFLSLERLLQQAARSEQDWRRITVNLPTPDAASVRFEIDRGNGAQPHKRAELLLDRSTGAVQERQGFADLSTGRQWRGIIRYAHTGEVLGFFGQTAAGVVSLTSLIMVWTGYALAWRRLIRPLLRKAGKQRGAG